ncbi:MAG TPA: bile acid:sodium symporter, partial [Spirochaetia bacterium]|nr:bile acid:sodium symporter [Spirochaetia bacterium]
MSKEFFRKNWFLAGIFTALTCGLLFPEFGHRINPNHLTNSIIIIVQFLILGLTLPSESILAGLKSFRLHTFVQLFIFVLTPLFFWLTSSLLRHTMEEGLYIGILALACLPTTVSSCIIFTQLSGGNVSATMFNASLSNILGVVLSPLLLSLLLGSTGKGLPAEEVTRVLLNLCRSMLLPIGIGQGSRILFKNLKKIVETHRKKLGILGNLLILTVIFLALSGAARNPALTGNLNWLLLPFLYLALSQILLTGASYAGARMFRFSSQDLISITYTAPQKTLAVGIPLLSMYFSQNPEILGLAILPLLFYHPWQLIVAGIFKGSVVPIIRAGER